MTEEVNYRAVLRDLLLKKAQLKRYFDEETLKLDTAISTIEQLIETGQIEAPEKNPHAVALGRLGGEKGGPARAESLSPTRRSEIASTAARARWGERDPESP